MLLAIFSAFFAVIASAQITVTAITFPAAGDTLRFAFDQDPIGIDNPATPPGGGQFWDFSMLSFDQTDETVYRQAGAGANFASFPGADLVVIGQQGETYYNVTSSQFQLLGFTGTGTNPFGLNLIARFTPALIERFAPMQFFDINNPPDSKLSIPFSTENLPDSLFQGVPPLFIPDSIRVSVTNDRLGLVDGWGTLKIPGGEYPVLREKRTDMTTTAIEILLFGNWVDASFLTGGNLGNFIGTDTTITYRFYSNTEKEEIAVATMSNDLSTTESVRFKNMGFTDAPSLEAPGNANVQAFPNPAVEWVRFDCTNLPTGEYSLKMFNIVGKMVWKETHMISGAKSIRVDLEPFKKGTYLYSLVDSKGHVISTKRLVVLKP